MQTSENCAAGSAVPAVTSNCHSGVLVLPSRISRAPVTVMRLGDPQEMGDPQETGCLREGHGVSCPGCRQVSTPATTGLSL